jgi:hypothetical protein
MFNKQNIMNENSTFFAPMIYLKQIAPAIEFYKTAFDAIVLRQWNNDDDSVHVAEMSITEHCFTCMKNLPGIMN